MSTLINLLDTMMNLGVAAGSGDGRSLGNGVPDAGRSTGASLFYLQSIQTKTSFNSNTLFEFGWANYGELHHVVDFVIIL